LISPIESNIVAQTSQNAGKTIKAGNGFFLFETSSVTHFLNNKHKAIPTNNQKV